MKKVKVSSLVKYLFPPMDNLFKGLIFIAAGIILSMIESNIWLLVLLCAIALFDFVPDIYKISDFLSQIKDLKKENKIDYVFSDFLSSESCMEGQLRIGKKYIFGKKSGRVVSYTDLQKAHHFIRKRYGYKQQRFVEVFTSEGDKIKLSKVSDNEKMIAEAEAVMSRIKILAPEADVSMK